MFLQQRGHLETAPPFTVPCEGREARFLHRSQRESNPGPSRGSLLRYRCTTQATLFETKSVLHYTIYLHNTNCPIVRSNALYRLVIRENE